jgi:PAS domain S-box-containing protein
MTWQEQLEAELAKKEEVIRNLKKQAELYQSLFNHIGVPVVYVNPGGELLVANSRWASLFDRSPESCTGLSLSEFFPDTINLFERRLREVMKTGKPCQSRDRHSQINGDCWYRTDFQPVCDENEKVTAIQILLSEINEWKVAEEKLTSRQTTSLSCLTRWKPPLARLFLQLMKGELKKKTPTSI